MSLIKKGCVSGICIMNGGGIDHFMRLHHNDRNTGCHGQRAQKQQTRNKLHFRREMVMYCNNKKSLSGLIIYTLDCDF
jgi:hypothetical protein